MDYSAVIANQNLNPYRRVSYETGIDMKFFKNRVGLDATYFRTINGPQIYALGNAPSVGQNFHNINGITTLNQGFEVSLNAAIFKRREGFNWNLSANWSTYRETLKEIADGYNELWLNGHNYKVGDRMDAYYGRAFVRDNQGNIVHTSAGLIYQPPSGDSQNAFLGNLNPDFSISVTNNLSYKNWSLSFQWDARVGGKIYDFMYAQAMNGGTAYESAAGDFGAARYKEWVSLRDNGTINPSYLGQGVVITSGTPKFVNGQISNMSELTFARNSTPVTVQSYITNLYNNTEYFMVDRSFVKLREASLSYSFPKEFLERTFLRSLSLSIVGRNLLYFAKRKDMDMDSFAAGFNSSDRSAGGAKGNVGLQSTSTRTIGFNVSIGF
ncbi:hypothetical protein I6H88_20095 [Elizabethkingia bruuniana]|uniref:TonB-dependent receptor-like beta-barrel domain-containing protein n=1 Tax=Elizabethkingia bruuniana TaxID=1756149 RepID=A0A7T7UYT3_9FLAO|nr:hypothetical protein [Elizabethkingia bruuniana]AQX85204.1 hypothetical protein AYC65_09370 [Elizabethkingia bruuniana]KUY28609.1 hypothetical protein ATB97_00300 [Elizabethkingia bruuniana]OPB70240.1 hypothetical protein BAY12_16410 [Elizabethkingia bruuniana]QDZ62419.1 hypothetical protein EVD20_05810 [Elizabethkingia bruuniana]QQN58696.1 hypothetical protein I6H88_20095 [Elizabethkingia bruuniana]